MDHKSVLYVVVVVAAAVAFAAECLPLSALFEFSPEQWQMVGAVTLLAFIMQIFAIDFVAGKEAQSSLAFIPLLAGAIILPPSATLITTIPVIFISEVILRRTPLKAAFNIAQVTLAVGVGAWIFHQWNGGGGTDLQSLRAVLGVVFLVGTFFSINVVLTSIGLALWRNEPLVQMFQTIVGPKGMNLVYDMLSSPIVFMVVAVYSAGGIWALAPLLTLLVFMKRVYEDRKKLEHTTHDLLYALVKAIETRDPYTSGHSRRVSTLAALLAEDAGLPARKVHLVRTAALLHDIGKIDAELSNLLMKPHSLTYEERRLIETHAARGADFLRDLGSLDKEIVAAVRHHHERYDGKGYPEGLSGDRIPLAARIIMLSDSIDAMLSDRPYRDAMSIGDVKKEVERCKGAQFDPHLVEVVLRHHTLEKAAALVDEWKAKVAVETLIRATSSS
jgi:putative nucleotidyltransferase with HDIG domain